VWKADGQSPEFTEHIGGYALDLCNQPSAARRRNKPMPIIEVNLTAGRSPEQLRTLITRLTDAAQDAIGSERDTIRVIIREVPRTHYAAGDVTVAESRGPA
jgi:4-oxalocrotonate tautomerase